jgi:DNA-binding transcriptional ArsR family regulator
MWNAMASRTPTARRGFPLRRILRAVRIAASDPRIPRPLRWLAALGVAPIPGPFDEILLVIVAVPLFLFYRGPLAEAWRQAAEPPPALHMPISEYIGSVARSSTTTDVFTALAEERRRAILDTLIGGEKAVGVIVSELALSQPQVSKHLRVLSEVGLVTYRAHGRQRLYRLEPGQLQPLLEWLAGYERALGERLDRMSEYLDNLQREGDPQ